MMRTSHFLLALALGGIAAAGEPEHESLRCGLQVQQRAVRYETVLITYDLRNVGSEPVNLRFRASPMSSFIKVFITDPHGTRKEYRHGVGFTTVQSTRTFEPGEGEQDQVLLIPGLPARDFVFPELGQYEIEVQCHFLIQQVAGHAAATRSIEIREPSAADKAALDLLGGIQEYRKSFLPGLFCSRSSQECYDDARLVIRGESAYAPVLCDILSSMLEIGYFGFPDEETLAIDVSEECLGRWPDHPTAPRVTLRLIRRLIAEGEQVAAESWIRRFEQKWRDRAGQAASARRMLHEAFGKDGE